MSAEQLCKFLLAITLVAGCASNSETRFHPLDETEVGGSMPFVAARGEKTTVAGIDVWQNGIPDRAYEEIGRITNTGVANIFGQSARLKDVARVAAYQGANAVVLLRQSEGDCIPNNIGGADCTNTREYAVVRYTE